MTQFLIGNVSGATAQPRNRATAQPRKSAGNSFAVNRLPFVTAGLRATIFQSPAIVARIFPSSPELAPRFYRFTPPLTEARK